MGLVDLRGEEMTSTTSSTQSSTPQRKKGTFDIAFLTGQSEVKNSEPIKSKESLSGRSSPSDSSDSFIDIINNGTTETELTSLKLPFCHLSSSTSNKKKNTKNNRKRKGRDESYSANIRGGIEQRSSGKIDTDRRCPIPSEEVMVPLLTSPFNFLPQIKGPTIISNVHFPGTFPQPPPGKIRRGFYGPSSSSSSEQSPFSCYPPYHPFLIGPPPPPPPPQEPINHHSVSNPTLLPPSLAALTLPAQNVCAKCKIGFRMTSDLVYHMRSHHKRETDPQKKKREDKLKCPVCHETFRERHHLTRHMTAHQDRAEEIEDKNTTT